MKYTDGHHKRNDTVLAFKERAGKPGGGKGILIGTNCSFTLSTLVEERICYEEPNKEEFTGVVLNDQGGSVMHVQDNIAATLRADTRDHEQIVLFKACGFMGGQGAKARTIAYTEETTPCIKSVPSGGNTVPDVVYPINTMVANRWNADDGRTCIGYGKPNDPQFTISSAHSHAVVYKDDGE